MEVFEYLEQMGLDRENVGRVRRFNLERTRQVTRILSEYLPWVDEASKHNPSIFSFSMNSQLNGRPFPCSSIGCRTAGIDEMARFALLYADDVVIPNPIHRVAKRLSSELTPSELSEVRSNLADELALLYHIQPLIEAGIARFGTATFAYCPNCYTNAAKLGGFEDRLSVMESALEEQYLSQARIRVIKPRGEFLLQVNGMDNVIEHGSGLVHLSVNALREMSNIGVLVPGKLISSSEMKELGVVAKLLKPLIKDLLWQNIYANIYGTQYLTNRKLDLDLLELVNDESGRSYNRQLDMLRHDLPFVTGAPLSDIAELRVKDGEEFRVYRDAMRAALETSIEAGSEREMHEMFQDIVRPELHKIDLKMKIVSSKRLRRFASYGILGGAMCVASATGIIPATYSQTALTVTGFAMTELIKHAFSAFDRNGDSNDQRFYFLWKVKNLAARACRTPPRTVKYNGSRSTCSHVSG